MSGMEHRSFYDEAQKQTPMYVGLAIHSVVSLCSTSFCLMLSARLICFRGPASALMFSVELPWPCIGIAGHASASGTSS